MFSLEDIKNNQYYKIVEIEKEELYGLKCWYNQNLIFDRAFFTCPKKCSKKQKNETLALLEAKLLELNLPF